MAIRYYNLVSTRDYAAMTGRSIRSVQRAVSKIPGAVQTNGNRWTIPVLSTQYAKHKGISVEKARKLGVKADSPSGATTNVPKGTIKHRAALHYYQQLQLAHTLRSPSFATIQKRMDKAKAKQLSAVLSITPNTLPHPDDQGWKGTDNESILFYH